jgi:hypothetical protein
MRTHVCGHYRLSVRKIQGSVGGDRNFSAPVSHLVRLALLGGQPTGRFENSRMLEAAPPRYHAAVLQPQQKNICHTRQWLGAADVWIVQCSGLLLEITEHVCYYCRDR